MGFKVNVQTHTFSKYLDEHYIAIAWKVTVQALANGISVNDNLIVGMNVTG